MRILIVRLSSLGDVVHALPAVQDIRRAFPGATIDWVVEPDFAPLLERVEGLRHVIACPLRRWRRDGWRQSAVGEGMAFVRELRARTYDAVIDLQGLTKSAVVARLAHGRRFGLANCTEGSSFEAPARWLIDDAIYIEPRIHAMDRSRELSARALGYIVDSTPKYGLHGRIACQRTQAPTLLLAHGTSRPAKLWPEAEWIELGRLAVADGWRVALPRSGAEENARARRIAHAIGTAAEVWDDMPLEMLVDQMALTQGVIGVDSGLSHIAVALGLPHVQVYTVPTAWRTGPLREHGSSFQTSVEVIPGRHGTEAVWRSWCSASAHIGWSIASREIAPDSTSIRY